MGTTDKRIDAYIAKSADFAKPILRHIRELVHRACPDTEEKMKWSFPHFDYEGSMMCSMAAFKQHCAFGFWKASIMEDPKKILETGEREAMGHFGQITSLDDLPSDKIMLSYIKEAMRLNEEGVKLPAKAKSPEKKELEVPDYFLKALKKNKNALSTFEGFSYSNKRDYVQWVVDAKTEETRMNRLTTAIEWMAEGKIRNWKYARK